MSKFIVITKKDIIKSIIYILLTGIFIYMIFFFFLKDNATFSTLIQNQYKDIVRDFDGDGSSDTLTTTVNDSYYNITIKTSNGEFPLISNANNINLIHKSRVNEIKFDFIDLSRDKIPEIIITGTNNNTPIAYIFKWSNNKFIEIFSTTKNIFGILDSKNSRTPQLLFTLSNKDNTITDALMFKNNTLKDINFSNPKVPSLVITQKFIDLVELTYELTETPEIFTSFIPSNELGVIWNLDKNTYKYSFQNAYFKDLEWNSQGIPSTIMWVLSFKKVNTLNPSSQAEELALYVTATIDELNEYKISSIKR